MQDSVSFAGIVFSEPVGEAGGVFAEGGGQHLPGESAPFGFDLFMRGAVFLGADFFIERRRPRGETFEAKQAALKRREVLPCPIDGFQPFEALVFFESAYSRSAFHIARPLRQCVFAFLRLNTPSAG